MHGIHVFDGRKWFDNCLYCINRAICLKISRLQVLSSALYPFGPFPSVSLSMVVLNSRIDLKIYGFQKECT